MSLFPSSSTRLVRDLLLRAPVLSHLASDKVRTSLRQRRISLGLNRHQVQGVGSSPAKGVISRPWQSSLPQKTVGTTPRPRFRITDPLALPFGGQPHCGSRRGRTSDHSTTGAIDIKRYFVAHHIVTSPRKLVRYRLNRHHPVRLGLLPLIISSDERVKANRKIRRFHKRPRQILVAVFRVASFLCVCRWKASHFPHTDSTRQSSPPSEISRCPRSPA